jgi:hypothetical protein
MTDNAYELIGKVTVEWNRIEMWWHEIFVAALGAPRPHADAIYLSLASFSTQRDITRPLVELRLADNQSLLAKFKDLDQKTGEAAGIRNFITHSRYLKSESSRGLIVQDRHKIKPNKNELIDKDVIQELVKMLSVLEDLEDLAWLALASLSVWIDTPEASKKIP